MPVIWQPHLPVYVLADEDTDLGFRTRQRIDNFITGIDDQNL